MPTITLSIQIYIYTIHSMQNEDLMLRSHKHYNFLHFKIHCLVKVTKSDIQSIQVTFIASLPQYNQVINMGSRQLNNKGEKQLVG